MVDKEDEKRQFTINVGSISQLEQPVRERVNQQIIRARRRVKVAVRINQNLRPTPP